VTPDPHPVAKSRATARAQTLAIDIREGLMLSVSDSYPLASSRVLQWDTSYTVGMLKRGILALFNGLLAISAVAQSHRLPVYDATSFANKPDLTDYGLKPITVLYPQFLWDHPNINDKTTMPDKTRVMSDAQMAFESTRILVIDIEHWPLSGDSAAVAQSIKQLQTVLQWAKTPAPNLKVGLYGAIPQRDYWAPNLAATNPERMRAWQQTNTSLSSLAAQVDIIFPSLYTFYDDQKGWQKYAVAQIQEARRVAPGKPVYVFLWPQFHFSNKAKADQFLSADYWTMELQTAQQYADGAVIWCCTGHQSWDKNAAWWQATLAFLKSN
jgi:hypothetical protein